MKRSTAYSYRTHLKLACALARKPVTGLTSPLVNMALRGKVSGNPIDVQTKKWVCGKDLLLKMVDYCLVNDLEWLKVLLIVCYTYQYRVFSEYFRVRYCDISFSGMQLEIGTQKLHMTVDRRKNRKVRHTLTRSCTCKSKRKKGEVLLGEKLCAVHALHKYLQSDPFHVLAAQSGSVDLRLMCDIDQATVNKLLKEVAAKVGDVHAAVAASHGLRRGHACDLALAGATLAEILEKGDWRSLAFKAYLESIKDELASQALMKLFGEVFDSEDEVE